LETPFVIDVETSSAPTFRQVSSLPAKPLALGDPKDGLDRNDTQAPVLYDVNALFMRVSAGFSRIAIVPNGYEELMSKAS
jgi:hypothetical protein